MTGATGGNCFHGIESFDYFVGVGHALKMGALQTFRKNYFPNCRFIFAVHYSAVSPNSLLMHHLCNSKLSAKLKG